MPQEVRDLQGWPCAHCKSRHGRPLDFHSAKRTCQAAKVRQCRFSVDQIRIGTCGGLGLEPGTISISEASLNGLLEPGLRSYILGKEVFRPANFDTALCNELHDLANELGYTAVVGKTMTADDFYEGQGRLDGAICDYTEEDKLAFLKTAYDKGVRNIEMESLTFAAFT